ncbi:MAG: uroporphyrinogen-III C-methyltransferase [Labilithrix sp.]|nr:uroporphyrinogen-III C-methyltransferase [Labilithrix sp.]
MLVVGGGAVATRKALDLVEARARVHVVAKEVSAELAEAAARELGPDDGPDAALTVDARGFEASDLHGMWLVFAATDDPVVQRQIADECEARQIFCVAIDDPPNATAYGGAVLRRGPVTIAISTSGEAPALARLLREVLEQALPEESFVDAARALRERWKSDRTPMKSRFAELVAAFKSRV